MNLTFKGFLKAYCRELSGQESLSFRKLTQLAESETPHVAEPMLLLAMCEDKKDYVIELTQGTWMDKSFAEALKFYEVGEDAEKFASSPKLPNRFSNVYHAYEAKKNAVQADRRLNKLMRTKTLEALKKNGLTCYKLCKDLGLNKGNVYAYLNAEDDSKVSCETAKKIMEYAESYVA